MSSVARVKVINRKTVFGSNPTYLVIQFEDGRFEKIDVLPNRREAIPEIGTYLFITYTEGSPIVVHSYSSQAPPGIDDPDENFSTREFPIILLIYRVISAIVNIIASILMVLFVVLYWNAKSPEAKIGMLGMCMIGCLVGLPSWAFIMVFDGILGTLGLIMLGFGFIIFFATFLILIDKGRELDSKN